MAFGPEVVQMPLHRVVERDALADEALAMVYQQPQIELLAVEVRRRQGIQAFAQRCPRDGWGITDRRTCGHLLALTFGTALLVALIPDEA